MSGALYTINIGRISQILYFRLRSYIMKLEGTKSLENIKAAFQGECTAIIRYLVFADIARNEGKFEDEDFFKKMAGNEMEHAKVWYKQFAEIPGDTIENLKNSAENENDEWKDMYPSFARTAKSEELLEISTLFERIASIECDHERKFMERVMMSENNEFEKKENQSTGKHYCLYCGFETENSMKMCPVCGGQDCFE